jgi:polysaccharide biosynthesis transport protein
MEETILSPADYINILKKRIWYLVIPCLLIVFITCIVAMGLPSIYKSTATILIENREIPAEYVQSSLTTYAEQRIQSINQRVLTSSRLLELIDRFHLYPELRKKITIDEIIAKMRGDISLDPVNVNIANRRTGRTVTATIAFTLSYKGKSPRKVQQVAGTVTSLFLKADLKVRKDQASSTHEFLRIESQKVRQKVADYEKELTELKEKHAHSLPQLFQVNMQAFDNIQSSIDREKVNLSTLKQKEGQLEVQLANTSPDIEASLPGGRLAKEEDELRLDALKIKLIEMRTKFSDLYPDVKKLKQEIKDLSKKVEQSKRNHKAEKKKNQQNKNPAYVTLSSNLAGVRSDITSVTNYLNDLEKEADVYRIRLAETPNVEEKYNALITERNALKAKFIDLQAKMMEAGVAQELESEQKGERFTLVESARLPEKPYKPNRLAIFFIGIVLGVGAGIVCVAIMEFMDTSIRNGEYLTRLTGFPVLTEIPKIVTREDKKKKRKIGLFIFAGFIVAVAVGIIIFNIFVMDLDVLWAKIMRKMT